MSYHTVLLALLVCATVSAAVDPDQGRERIPASPIPWPVLGQVAPRPASAIAADNGWSIGAETMDRNYGEWRISGPWLGHAGAKRVRLQGGWARCEQVKGVYDFAWLDEVVDGARAQGVQPWLEVSYGNPLYGGMTDLGSLMPGPEALDAWDAWVKAMVVHFRDRVDTWEIWNEPDGAHTKDGRRNDPAAFAHFSLRTATVIRSVQPAAKLWHLALAAIHVKWVEALLAVGKERQELGLIDAIAIHGYVPKPESSHGGYAACLERIAQADPRIRLVQGENGAPSQTGGFGALVKFPWTELSQAKWNLRRCVGDRLRGLPVTNLFTLCDLRYPGRINHKGILRLDTATETLSPKQAWHAFRHLTALLDAGHQRNEAVTVTAPKEVLAGALGSGDALVVAAWRTTALPEERLDVAPADLEVAAAIADPVVVDVRSGSVHAIPASALRVVAGRTAITGLPLYDSPVLVMPRGRVAMR